MYFVSIIYLSFYAADSDGLLVVSDALLELEARPASGLPAFAYVVALFNTDILDAVPQ